MISVTRPFLPPKEEYEKYISDIWKRNWLTNNGPLLNDLELALKEYLEINHLLFVSNGTIALQLAIKALELKGEIITTPFSYVATTSSIVWEGCAPVFVDIDDKTLNIDATKIEKAISEKTTGIVATHCFGNACDIDAIEAIAKKYQLKVIYDAAHCFGTLYKERSILDYGDVSTCSFHATKLYHTVEGGAVTTQDPMLLKKMAHMRNFGHDGFEKYFGVGINGKNSELHAAMGLCNLKYVDQILEKRKEQCGNYDRLLTNLDITTPEVQDNCQYNYAYYPIIFSTEKQLIQSKIELEKWEISPRRYFFPSLSHLPYVKKQNTPVSDNISKRILCLPLSYDLTSEEQRMIARILLRVQNN